jgi:hypothetical protein
MKYSSLEIFDGTDKKAFKKGIELVMPQLPFASFARIYTVLKPLLAEVKFKLVLRFEMLAEGFNPDSAIPFPNPGSVLKKYSMRSIF